MGSPAAGAAGDGRIPL